MGRTGVWLVMASWEKMHYVNQTEGLGLREHYESREVLIMIATKDERRTRKASTWKGKNTGSEQGVVAENKQQTHFQLKPELETNPHLIT